MTIAVSDHAADTIMAIAAIAAIVMRLTIPSRPSSLPLQVLAAAILMARLAEAAMTRERKVLDAFMVLAPVALGATRAVGQRLALS
jgi:hypothetical protein